jgi:hypothetical protein
MATKTDFTPEESTLLRAAPVLAGLRVAVADHGGNFDEVAAIAEAYGAAHERLWSTPPRGGVVDEIIADGPFYDRAHFGDSPDKLDAERITEASRTSLRDAVALLERKVSAAEVEAYREFVLDLARRVGGPSGGRSVRPPRPGQRTRTRRAGRAGVGVPDRRAVAGAPTVEKSHLQQVARPGHRRGGGLPAGRSASLPPGRGERGTRLRDGACGTVRCTRVVRPSTRRLKSSFASAARRR